MGVTFLEVSQRDRSVPLSQPLSSELFSESRCVLGCFQVLEDAGDILEWAKK